MQNVCEKVLQQLYATVIYNQYIYIYKHARKRFQLYTDRDPGGIPMMERLDFTLMH